jgi:hypothetical protein
MCGKRRSSIDRGAWLALLCGLTLVPAALRGDDQPPASQPSNPWSPIRAVEFPAEPGGWARTPIDCFIRAQQVQFNLAPEQEANRRTLLRRVTFDLLGLPPTPDEWRQFLADSSPDAYERLVDRLLASPHYGEHWGRHWLDVARYADSGGFEADLPYKNAWMYRDYTIRSFNADKPADRFIQEQVGGDELWPDDPEAVIATGLYCVGPAVTDAAMVSGQLEYDWLTDAADTTGAVFLGLTLGCARCHDHKYDPLTQRDYFAMQAIFAASDRAFPEKFRLTRVKAINGLLSDAPVAPDLLSDPRCSVRTEDQIRFGLFHRAEPVIVRRLDRGELSKAAEPIEPGFPVALGARAPDAQDVAVREHGGRQAPPANLRRAALAAWLTAPNNPLSARVLVNRIWDWHFGQPIVPTPNDFGAQGDGPTHPELLDWLARDLTSHGWQLKRLHRVIVNSATYRQSSMLHQTLSSIDPQNRLLWHFPRQRLTGESVRDAMLQCAGTLNTAEFGPPVVPPLSSEELTGLFDAKGKWPVTKDVAEHRRRSIYILVRRTFTYPLFAVFDPPEVMTSCSRRRQTVVPNQALALLNSPVSREQAAAFARRLVVECGEDPDSLVSRAWLLALSRSPTQVEQEEAKKFLERRAAAASSSVAKVEFALSELCLGLFNTNEFAYID